MEAVQPSFVQENILSCDVYVGSTFVGILSGEATGNNVCFSYDQEYAKKQVPLGPDLPLNQLVHQGQGLPPFFRHYIAEGPVKKVYQGLLSSEAPAEVSELLLLMHFPHDFFGDLKIVPHKEMHVTSDSSKFSPDTRFAAINSSMFPGWRPKYLAYQDDEGNYFLSSGLYDASTHIIKIRSEDDTAINRLLNEYLSLNILGRLLPKDQISDLSLGEVIGLEDDVLRIKRFDRVRNNGNVEKVDFREFAQLLGYAPEKKDEAYFREMADFMHDHLPIDVGNGNARNIAGDQFFTNKDDIETLYKRVCAFFLIGNGDAHLKNFGLVKHQDGTWRLSPIYDVETTAVYNDKKDLMALGVGTVRGLNIHKLNASHLVMLAQDFRLEPERAVACIQEIRSNIDRAFDFPLTGVKGDQQMRKKIISLMMRQSVAFDKFEEEMDRWIRKGKYQRYQATRPPKNKPRSFAKFCARKTLS